MKLAICTLAFNRRYRALAVNLIGECTDRIAAPYTFTVVTDDVSAFKGLPVKAIGIKDETPDLNLKEYAIRSAYENDDITHVMFLDADTIIEGYIGGPDFDFFEEGLNTCTNVASLAQFGNPPIATKFIDHFGEHGQGMVFKECCMVFRVEDNPEHFQKFLDEWEYIRDRNKKRGLPQCVQSLDIALAAQNVKYPINDISKSTAKIRGMIFNLTRGLSMI